MTTLQEKPAQSPKVLERKQKKVNRKILDLKTFQTQADNGFDDLSKKLLEEAEKIKNEKKNSLRTKKILPQNFSFQASNAVAVSTTCCEG